MGFPNLTDLNYFLAVVKTENLSAAALDLGVSQSTLSTSLVRLESTLGAKLYARRRSGIMLTRSGHAFANEARNLIAHWRRVAEVVQEEDAKLGGNFTIACAPSAGYAAAGEGIKRLRTLHPDISISFINNVPTTVADLVIRGHVDFGLSTLADPHPDVKSRKIMNVEIGIWQRRDSLAEETTIIYDKRLIGTDRILKGLAKPKPIFTHHMTCQSIDLVAGLVAKGVGAGILVDQVAAAFGETTLKRIYPKIRIRYDFYLLYRKELAGSASAQHVIKALTTKTPKKS